MKRSQQVMAHMFSALAGAFVCGLGGMVLGYFVAGIGAPSAPDAPSTDYLQWGAYSLESFFRHGKGIFLGGGLGTVTGAIGGYVLNRRLAQQAPEETPPPQS